MVYNKDGYTVYTKLGNVMGSNGFLILDKERLCLEMIIENIIPIM